ncbi:MAG: VOC family protein [Pseudomonadota bacterium]
MSALRAMPVLDVADVVASEAFYQGLGFDSHGVWRHEGEAEFCIVQRGDVTLALNRGHGPIPRNHYWAAYLYVSDVAALHAEFTALDLPELTAIRRDNPYGCDDFDLTDPDGHRLAFGQSHDPTPGPGLDETRGRG